MNIRWLKVEYGILGSFMYGTFMYVWWPRTLNMGNARFLQYKVLTNTVLNWKWFSFTRISTTSKVLAFYSMFRLKSEKKYLHLKISFQMWHRSMTDILTAGIGLQTDSWFYVHFNFRQTYYFYHCACETCLFTQHYLCRKPKQVLKK